MRRLAGLATAMLALAAATSAAQAREHVATLPQTSSTTLALSGASVAWVEGTRDGGTRVRIASPGAPPRTVVSFGPPRSDHVLTFQDVTVDASPSHLAVLRRIVGADPVSRYNIGRTTVVSEELWAGPPDGEMRRVATCEPGGPQPMLSQALAVSGTRVVTGDCVERRALTVRDLSTGVAHPVLRGGQGGEHVDLAGRYLAWEESDQDDSTVAPRTIVVHDLDTGTDAYRVRQPRYPYTSHGPFYVQADGKLLDPQLSDDRGAYAAWYSPAEQFEHRLVPQGLRLLSGDRTLGVHNYGELIDLTVHGLDGSYVQVARMSAGTLVGSDFDGGRVAWAETRCDATVVYTQPLGDPFSVSRSALEGRCPSVSVPGAVTVSSRGIARLPLRCREMRRCAGTVRLISGSTTVAKARFAFGRRSHGSVILRPPPRTASVTVRVSDRNGLTLAERTLSLRR